MMRSIPVLVLRASLGAVSDPVAMICLARAMTLPRYLTHAQCPATNSPVAVGGSRGAGLRGLIELGAVVKPENPVVILNSVLGTEYLPRQLRLQSDSGHGHA